MEAMSALISVQNIVKRFGGLTAVDDCSLDVPKGSITGLIGPNGAGKSTLFNIIAGALPPSSGKVLLEGRDVTGLKPHQLFQQGLVRTFQIPHELGRMTVLENLMMVPSGQAGENLISAWLSWGRVQREDAEIRRKAMEVLDILEITHVAGELAGNLSGGQKKLLELGRTMMVDNCRVILLDEPAAGVNRTLLVKLADVIRRLNRERGMTFCIIEHDMDLVTELCDPVIVMAQGTVLTQGTMAEIRANQTVLDAYLGSAGDPEAFRRKA
ncbi:ABC transporter ATP-binding protein [Tistrella mobilis]|uniref:ABC transporter ATP-binding protein n=1 Tax=Tistrella mobilis TaxID=171437 RepID=UPI0009EF40DF|nr:ABC transporter ATP-binding protein [Tistrella mobilis]